MVWYLVNARRADGLLVYMLKSERWVCCPHVRAFISTLSRFGSWQLCLFGESCNQRLVHLCLPPDCRTLWAWCRCSTWCTRTASRRRRLPDCRPLARTCWRWENAQPWAEELLMRSSGWLYYASPFVSEVLQVIKKKKKKWLPGVIEEIRSECTPPEVKPRSSHLRFPRREVLVFTLRGNGGAKAGTHQAWLELTSLRPWSGGEGQGEWQPVNVKR